MATLGADLADVAAGRVAHAADRAAPLPAGRLPPRGVVVAVLDSACGCAALTLMQATRRC